MYVRFGWERKDTVRQAVDKVGADALIDTVIEVMPPDYLDGEPLQVTVDNYCFRGCVVRDVLVIEKASPVRTRKTKKI